MLLVQGYWVGELFLGVYLFNCQTCAVCILSCSIQQLVYYPNIICLLSCFKVIINFGVLNDYVALAVAHHLPWVLPA